jgi:hypothetical protein
MAARKDARFCCDEHSTFQSFENKPHLFPTGRVKKSPFHWNNIPETLRKTGISEENITAYMKKHAGRAAAALNPAKSLTDKGNKPEAKPVVLLQGDAVRK